MKSKKTNFSVVAYRFGSVFNANRFLKYPMACSWVFKKLILPTVVNWTIWVNLLNMFFLVLMSYFPHFNGNYLFYVFLSVVPCGPWLIVIFNMHIKYINMTVRKGNVTSSIRNISPTELPTYCNIGPTSAVCRSKNTPPW